MPSQRLRARPPDPAPDETRSDGADPPSGSQTTHETTLRDPKCGLAARRAAPGERHSQRDCLNRLADTLRRSARPHDATQTEARATSWCAPVAQLSNPEPSGSPVRDQ